METTECLGGSTIRKANIRKEDTSVIDDSHHQVAEPDNLSYEIKEG